MLLYPDRRSGGITGMLPASYHQAVRSLALFQDLTEAQMAALNDGLCRRIVPAGTCLTTMGQPADVVYILLAGTVKLYVENSDGTPVILGILGPGDLLGETSACDGLGHLASAVTLQPCTLLWVSRACLCEHLGTMPVLYRNLARLLSSRLRLAAEHIQSLARQDVYARVARQLLYFAYQYNTETGTGTVIPLRLTQTDLANLIGASRVRVNQVLAAYKRSHYISIDERHYITIHNHDELARRCQ